MLYVQFPLKYLDSSTFRQVSWILNDLDNWILTNSMNIEYWIGRCSAVIISTVSLPCLLCRILPDAVPGSLNRCSCPALCAALIATMQTSFFAVQPCSCLSDFTFTAFTNKWLCNHNNTVGEATAFYLKACSCCLSLLIWDTVWHSVWQIPISFGMSMLSATCQHVELLQQLVTVTAYIHLIR